MACTCASVTYLALFYQVNGQNMERWTHETAAKALMTAGNRVTLKVIYKPEGESVIVIPFQDFNFFLPRIRGVPSTVEGTGNGSIC